MDCGKGNDDLTGGAGGDHFLVLSSADTGVGAAKRDHITDLVATDGGRTVLTAFDAVAAGTPDPLSFMGIDAFTGTCQIRATIHRAETWNDST